MNERLNKIFEVTPKGDIEQATYYGDSAGYVGYKSGDKIISLDGGFSAQELRFFADLMDPKNAGVDGGEYYVAYTLRDGPPIMNFDAFKTHELAQSFIHELNESRRAFSVAGVLRFSMPNVKAQR